MLNYKNICFTLIATCLFSSCISSTTDYRISIPSIAEKSAEFEVHYWGVVQIKDKQFEAFIRPVNKIQTGYGNTFFFLFSFDKKIKDGNNYFIETVASQKEPGKFLIELYLKPNEKLSFNPMDCKLSINERPIRVSNYYIVKTDDSGRAIRDKFKRPLAGANYLFTGSESEEALRVSLSDTAEYVITTETGFILVFDHSPPIPGKDVFKLTINTTPPLNINFNQSREIVRDFDL